MSTTTSITIRLPDDLKVRIAALAKSAGITAHGFILAAIAEKTTASTSLGLIQGEIKANNTSAASDLRKVEELKAATKNLN